MQRWVKVVTAIGVVLVLMLIVAAALSVWAVRRSFPQTGGELTVPGLTSEVQVLRDDYGIPQIYADNPSDLFFAQGYVQAQDRFFEMDFRRHVTAGRLSELFGEDTVETDTFVRTLGWRHVAAQELALLDPSSRRYLEDFARGVNAYISDRSPSELSLEYTVLGLGGLDYTPEPWTPVDSLAWLKAMAWDLGGNLQDEIDRVLISHGHGAEEIAQLYPSYPYRRHQPIVDQGAVVDGVFEQEATKNTSRRPKRAMLPASVVEQLRGIDRAAARLPTLLGDGSGIGSNSWVVSGDHTATGMPILANDPHLAPSMPGIWYQMGLHCRQVTASCPFDVAGYTFAGLPGVVIGHNDTVAWGMTNLGPDVMDLYLEAVDEQTDTYLYNGRQHPLLLRRETISVAGGEDVHLVVRATRHGPLLSDVDEAARQVVARSPGTPNVQTSAPETMPEATAVALRWTALQPRPTADAIFALNRARSWDEFRAAARDFSVPAQNLVYADVEGHIGYQAPGRIPIRRTGDGDWPVPGWDPAYEWVDFVPFDALPSLYDPDDGVIVTANQAVVNTRYPYFLGDSWAYGYRSQRIHDLIADERSLTVEDMNRIQLDSWSANGADLIPYLLDVRVDDYTRQGQRVLRSWDGHQGPESAGAAFFAVVWKILLEKTFHDELPEEAWPDGGGRWFAVMRDLMADPGSPWWDDVDTPRRESRNDILQATLTEARLEITRRIARKPRLWRWGHLHTLELVNQSLGTSGIGAVEWLFNRGPAELGGSTAAVDATGWDATEGFEVDWVPSMRMVVSLDDLDDSTWVNLTGASGHAFNSHYDDQFELWANGETRPWAFGREAVRDTAEDTLTLRPAEGDSD